MRTDAADRQAHAERRRIAGRLAGRLAAAWRAGPLAVRDFRLLGIGQLTSTVGDFCYAVALPWLVLSAHGGPALLGTVLACYGVPRTVLIPLGGVLADRTSPRAVMLAADSVRCVLTVALVVLAARDVTSLAYLGPVAALLGAGGGVFLPASMALMPSVLPPEQLQAGNGLFSAMVQVGTFVGPVVGGILVTTTGPGPAFAVDAASFAVSAASLALMRAGRRATAVAAATAAAADPGEPGEATPAGAPSGAPAGAHAGAHAGAQSGAPAGAQSGAPAGAHAGAPAGAPSGAPAGAPSGAPSGAPAGLDPGRPAGGAWRLLRQSAELRVLLVVSVIANFVIGGAFEVALPALAHARFGPAGYGALVACFGVGAIAGTLVAARLTGLARPATDAGLVFLVGALAVVALPFLGGLPGAAAADLVFGAAASFGNVVLITLLQRWAPPELLGRVMSLIMLASLGAFPVAVALSGWVVSRIGSAPFFPAAGAVFGLTVLFALAQGAFRRFGAVTDLAPARAGEPPAEPGDQAAVVAR